MTEQLPQPHETRPTHPERRRRKYGLLLAVAGAATIGLNFIFAKYAMSGMPFLTFMVLWFTAGTMYSGLYLAIRRRPVKEQLARYWKPLLMIGVLTGISALTGFAGLRLLDPTVAAFLSRTSAVFGVLLGLMALRERPPGIAWLGMAVAVVGIVVLSYATGAGGTAGIVCSLLGALFASLALMVGKVVAREVSTVLTIYVRAVTIVLMVLPAALVMGQLSFEFEMQYLGVLLAGAFFGPFVSQILFFHALSYISLSEVSVVRAATPLFVAVYALIFLSMFPGPRQIAGGILVLAGIVLLTQSRPVRERT